MVYKDETGAAHTVKGSTEGIRKALPDRLLGDAATILVSRTEDGPVSMPLASVPEFRDLVVQPAQVSATPGARLSAVLSKASASRPAHRAATAGGRRGSGPGRLPLRLGIDQRLRQPARPATDTAFRALRHSADPGFCLDHNATACDPHGRASRRPPGANRAIRRTDRQQARTPFPRQRGPGFIARYRPRTRVTQLEPDPDRGGSGPGHGDPYPSDPALKQPPFS